MWMLMLMLQFHSKKSVISAILTIHIFLLPSIPFHRIIFIKKSSSSKLTVYSAKKEKNYAKTWQCIGNSVKAFTVCVKKLISYEIIVLSTQFSVVSLYLKYKFKWKSIEFPIIKCHNRRFSKCTMRGK